MRTSEKGIALIKAFEGFPYGGRPYRQPGDVWTIGYGHTEGVGPNTPRITQQEADALLREDLAKKYEPYVNQAANRYRLSLNQNRFDALVSFVYNLGPLYLQPAYSMGAALKAHNFAAAAAAFLNYTSGPPGTKAGLTRRRKAEAALFRTPYMSPARIRYYRVREALLRRRQAGLASPGILRLLARLRDQIRKEGS
jgi:lysozyme